MCITALKEVQYLPVGMTTSDVTTTSLLPVLLDHISYSRDLDEICYVDNKVFTIYDANDTRVVEKTPPVRGSC